MKPLAGKVEGTTAQTLWRSPFVSHFERETDKVL
jgi:hypothetical protein